MCSLYTIRTSLDQIARIFNARLECEPKPISEGERITPKQDAPVILLDNQAFVLKLFRFSLVPCWSKEKKVAFATHNARLDAVDKKPAWKAPFLSNHCVVPMNEFVEAIYEGTFAGNMVAIYRHHNEPMYAAGIFDSWRSPEGEQLYSFAVITDDACDFVKGIGHHRQPVLLDTDACRTWLKMKGGSAEKMRLFLRQHCNANDLAVRIDRPMKAGWEKRIGKTLGQTD